MGLIEQQRLEKLLTDDEKAALERIPLEQVVACVRGRQVELSEACREREQARREWSDQQARVDRMQAAIGHLKARLENEL